MTPIREFVWQDPVIVMRDGKPYKMHRHLSDLDIDHLNANYHILVNDPHRDDWYTVVMRTIQQVEIAGVDWWYQDGIFIFTHESDKALVYLTIK